MTEERDRRRVTRDPVVVDHAERLAGLGTWEWIPATGELRWSDNMFRLGGLEVGAIVPTAEYVLERVHRNDRRQVEAVLDLLTVGEHRSVDYRFRRDDGELVLLRATVAVVSEGDDGVPRILGLVQDLTAQRQLEREVATRIAVTEALERWRTLEDGATDLLAGIAREMELALAALWVPVGEGFAVRAVWNAASPALEELAAATVRWRPGAGSPTVGRAAATGRPVGTAEVSASAPRDRVLALRAAGISTALCVPAGFAHETVAVLELLSEEPVVLTDRLARALSGIGHEIGHFLASRRGELLAASLTPRAVEVLQLAARGCAAEEIADRLGVSQATVKRHFERAYVQLGVSGRAAAVAEAMRRGLIT